jgi:hypothetical protein
MSDWFTSCFDELRKIAAAEPSSILNPEEKRKQMLQFAALGGTLVPAISSLSTRIQTGKWLPKGVPLKRYLPATVAQGLFCPKQHSSGSTENGGRERTQAACARGCEGLAGTEGARASCSTEGSLTWHCLQRKRPGSDTRSTSKLELGNDPSECRLFSRMTSPRQPPNPAQTFESL